MLLSAFVISFGTMVVVGVGAESAGMVAADLWFLAACGSHSEAGLGLWA